MTWMMTCRQLCDVNANVVNITVPDVSMESTERYQPPTRISDRPKKTTWKPRQLEKTMPEEWRQMEKVTPGKGRLLEKSGHEKRKHMEKTTPGKRKQLEKMTPEQGRRMERTMPEKQKNVEKTTIGKRRELEKMAPGKGRQLEQMRQVKRRQMEKERRMQNIATSWKRRNNCERNDDTAPARKRSVRFTY